MIYRSLGRDQMCCACSFKQKNEDRYTKPDWLEEHNAGKLYMPSYNIAPTDITPVLVSSRKFRNTASAIALKPMMWGIIPPWHKVRSHFMYVLLIANSPHTSSMYLPHSCVLVSTLHHMTMFTSLYFA